MYLQVKTAPAGLLQHAHKLASMAQAMRRHIELISHLSLSKASLAIDSSGSRDREETLRDQVFCIGGGTDAPAVRRQSQQIPDGPAYCGTRKLYLRPKPTDTWSAEPR